jgi:protein gp37
MSSASNIEWTESTWNPVRGCTKISPGCKHCYAETFAERFRGVKGHPYEEGFDLRLVPEKVQEPLHWKKPRRIFVNSMSDLFHEDVPDQYIASVWETMARAHWHTFQVLTKRADRLPRFLKWLESTINTGTGTPAVSKMRWPLPNVWLGVSVESQEYADERIPHLLRTPAAVRFLSCEPLLGPVTLNPWLLSEHGRRHIGAAPGIGWVIIGGESGGGARPFNIEWARAIVQQCRAAGVAPFVKQVGANVEWNGISGPGEHWPKGTRTVDTGQGCFRVGLNSRHKGGLPSEWPEDLRVREYPNAA